VEKLLDEISDCVNKQDTNSLLRFLKSKVSPFKAVVDDNIDWYMAQLTQEKESKLVIFSLYLSLSLSYCIFFIKIFFTEVSSEGINCFVLVFIFTSLTCEF
jgi:hypothetical protein